jgi:pimeloyl-ACP methyl ester carboxylesterase
VGDDLHQLTAALGRPVPVVANSQGAPFALAAAVAGAASSLVLVSPVDEVAHPATTAKLPEPVRERVSAVAANPEQAAARFAGFSAESFFDFVLTTHPPSDAAVFGEPGFRALFRATLAEGFGQGPTGYARDTVLAMLPWRLDLAAIDVPVTILFGGDDQTHSPDLGATLTSRIPPAERIIVPGIGGSLLWARPALVLDAASAEHPPPGP